MSAEARAVELHPYCTQLEPDALVQAFLHFPPTGFQAWRSGCGLPVFATRFDLLTTAHPVLRGLLQGWPLRSLWQCLQPLTCFVGTTVSEYVLLPDRDMAAERYLQCLLQELAPRFPLLIIKDVPCASPLLPAAANQQAAELERCCAAAGFIAVEGQALAWVEIDFASVDDFMRRFSASRRRNFRRKLKGREQVQVEMLVTGSAAFRDAGLVTALYALYCNVYEQSSVHFDRLSPEFFSWVLQDVSSGGLVFLYRCQGELAAFNLCYRHGDILVDKYIGFSYPLAHHHHLYFLSWFHNLEFARAQGLRRYVAGWTDPEVKASLGAQFTFTRHLVYVRNPLLRALLRHCAGWFEADAQWQALRQQGQQTQQERQA